MLRRGLEYDKGYGIVISMRDRDVAGCGSHSVYGFGGNIVELDDGLAGRKAGRLDISPEYAATQPRTQRFESGFFDGESGRQT